MKIELFAISLDAQQMVFDQNSLNDFLADVDFKKSAVRFVKSPAPYWSVLIHYEEKEETEAPFSGQNLQAAQTEAGPPEPELTEYEQYLFGKLKLWRNEKAAETNLPAYLICHNAALEQVARRQPENLVQLREVKGFGELKTGQYGAQIIALIHP